MLYIFRSFLLVVFLIGSSQTRGTSIEPEKIVSITQKLYEMEYYHTQVRLWKEKVEEKQNDANAWMNYYLACRIVNILTEYLSPHNLQEIYEGIQENTKGSYEYHYLTYLHGRLNTSLFQHLLKHMN